jgi:uracil-DNA glycosylase
MTGELDPLSELRFLTEALRAHAEWQQACGAAALPPADVRSLGLNEPLPLARVMPALPSELAEGGAAPRSSTPNQAPRQPVANPAPATVAAQASPLSAEERAGRLTVLADAVKGCARCVLHEARTQTVFARGNGSSGLCFVGEGPGADEDAQGLPFVGPAGQLLDRMIAAMGIERDDVYVCNIVKCRPPKNRTPEPEEMSACMPYLTEQLALVEPRVIVALGKTAVQGLFGTAEGITRIRGRWRLYQGRVAVMPTFHPAYLLRNPAAKREVWADLQLVLKHLGRSLPTKGG